MDVKKELNGYFEISVEVGHEALEAVADFLISLGSGGVAYDDGPEAAVRGYFRPEQAEDNIRAIEQFLMGLPSFGLNPGAFEVTSRFIPDADWANAWREHYKVIHVGKRLVIRPVWEEYEAKNDEVVIDMDPGMAFGTGEHGTTMLCLEALDVHVQPGLRVADIGTGSGILAIAAAKLGAARVDAIDNDPEAIRVAERNVVDNGVQDKVVLNHGTIDLLKNVSTEPYDIVVMNIIADVIIESLPELRRYVAERTELLLSGIIDLRRNDVEEAVAANGLTLVEWKQKGEWLLAHVRR